MSGCSLHISAYIFLLFGVGIALNGEPKFDCMTLNLMLDVQVYRGLACENEFGPHFAQGSEIRPPTVTEVCGNVEAVRVEEVYGTKC